MNKHISPLGSDLLNRKNSREKIPTPALILDLDQMERNLSLAVELAKNKKMKLRPHCKSHKSKKIAEMQVEKGALGISCATLGEAEAMADESIFGILITSPIVSESKIARLIALNQKAKGLMVVVDHLQNVESLSQSNRNQLPLQVLIDFDIGQKRTGVKSVEEAIALFHKIENSPALAFAGVQAYGGHFQHVISYSERRKMIQEQNKRIRELQNALQNKTKKPFIVTGGGTGTFDIDLDEDVYTELQIGSYLFMDVEYEEVEMSKERAPFLPALFVNACVVSTNPDYAVVDAGLKAFATDGPKPLLFSGLSEKSSYQFMGDEHGKICYTHSKLEIPLGVVLEFIVPHCDPTVNLYDFYHCVRENTLVDIWPIDARGSH